MMLIHSIWSTAVPATTGSMRARQDLAMPMSCTNMACRTRWRCRIGDWPQTSLPGSLLFGNTGNDRIFGGDGEDILIGGEGDDELMGGTGADAYVIRGGGMDTVFDDGMGLWTRHRRVGLARGRRYGRVTFVNAKPCSRASTCLDDLGHPPRFAARRA